MSKTNDLLPRYVYYLISGNLTLIVDSNIKKKHLDYMGFTSIAHEFFVVDLMSPENLEVS